jgi:hypothetical protein
MQIIKTVVNNHLKLGIMKNVFYLVLATVFLFGCGGYTERTKFELEQMKTPVILINKTKHTLWCSVTLQDGNGKVYEFGNVSTIANSIGDNYSINDTIRK